MYVQYRYSECIYITLNTAHYPCTKINDTIHQAKYTTLTHSTLYIYTVEYSPLLIFLSTIYDTLRLLILILRHFYPLYVFPANSFPSTIFGQIHYKDRNIFSQLLCSLSCQCSRKSPLQPLLLSLSPYSRLVYPPRIYLPSSLSVNQIYIKKNTSRAEEKQRR